MRSLRWQFLGAFIAIIVFAVVLSGGIGYFTIREQLDAFVAEIRLDEAKNIARNLSEEYTLTGGWETVDQTLSKAGHFYDGESLEKLLGESGDDGGHAEGEEEDPGFFHQDAVRIVIVDVDGHVIRDNFFELVTGEAVPQLDGQRVPINDLDTGLTVGYVVIDVNQTFLATESLGFLTSTLYATIFGGLLTAGIALALAVWLSKRITAPVTALTEATQAIAQKGNPELLSITSTDELGQMSLAFNQMTSALKTQRDLRKRLINDVSHELNNPLSVIHLEAKGLQDGLQTPSEAAENIIQEVNMLRNLVGDLDWLAETDSGELQLKIEHNSLHEVLTTEAKRWQPQAQAQQIELSLEVGQELPLFDFDRMRISQALGNIIKNALQHTPVGGHMTIRSTINNGNAIISVTDEGVGIAAEDLPYIFDRFYRADRSRSRGTHGTGLGLAIAQAIVKSHEGSISVASEGIGKGTTVSIKLPLY